MPDKKEALTFLKRLKIEVGIKMPVDFESIQFKDLGLNIIGKRKKAVS